MVGLGLKVDEIGVKMVHFKYVYLLFLRSSGKSIQVPVDRKSPKKTCESAFVNCMPIKVTRITLTQKSPKKWLQRFFSLRDTETA